jgi:RNA polymerase sigma-70 factor (ECF subfamily)
VPDTRPEHTVRRAQDGDVAAFEQLYRHNVNRVYALCFRMTGDHDRAEQLTQDAFVHAWEKLSTFRGESAFGTWLHRLAVNIVLQDQRSRQQEREKSVLHGERDDSDRVIQSDGTDERIDLDRALASLPDGARSVFVLHDIEGYSHREIAEMLGIAEGTSKAQLHRAKKLLRSVLNK